MKWEERKLCGGAKEETEGVRNFRRGFRLRGQSLLRKILPLLPHYPLRWR